MLSDLIFVLNGVVPIFIVVFIGYFLKRKGFLTDEFVRVADKLVFKLLLPCFLFTKVADMDKDSFYAQDVTVVLFALAAVLAVSFGTLLICTPLIRDSAKRGAFVQGVYRSNTAILGVPFAENLFGADGARVAAILLAFVVPLYNVIAVIILSVCDPKKNEGQSVGQKAKAVARDIVKNPLIISIAIGLVVCFSGAELPKIADKTIAYLAGASTPLALIAIGANFSFSDMKGRAGLAVTASVLKTVCVPACVIFAANLCGFNGAHLGALFIVFGTPAAVSSYIMAKNMNNDYKLASQIIVFTTLLSALTVSAGSFLLFQSGLVLR